MKNVVRKSLTIALMALPLTFLSSQANAQTDGFNARITFMEPSYMPDYFYFTADNGSTFCPAGKALKYHKNVENNKIVHNVILAAMLAGKVTFLVVDRSSHCSVQYVHILN